jgi:CheY-like chemotaxis protein
VLRGAGLAVDVAGNGAVACDMVLAAERDGRQYDVILMDMQMPEMDGYTATRTLRSAGFQGAIIAVTAHAMAADIQPCLAAGCDDYCAKPIRIRTLLDKVEQHLSAGARR